MKIEGVELIQWNKPVLSDKERIKKKTDKNRKINKWTKLKSANKKRTKAER